MDTPTRLRRMREAAGFTQAQLARRLKKASYWVSNRETGRTDCTVPEREEWAEACGYEIAILEGPAGSDAIERASELSQVWPTLTDAERGMLSALITQWAGRAESTGDPQK